MIIRQFEHHRDAMPKEDPSWRFALGASAVIEGSILRLVDDAGNEGFGYASAVPHMGSIPKALEAELDYLRPHVHRHGTIDDFAAMRHGEEQGRSRMSATLRARCARKTLPALAVSIYAATLLLIGSPAANAQDILLNRAPDREQAIIDGARKEGQVVLYSAAIVNQALRPLTDAFNKKYPFVRMTFWRGDSEEIIAKLSAESRARNLVADLVEGTGVGELAVVAGLALPYHLPAVQVLPERYRDPTNHWVSTRISYFSIAYNTRQVALEHVPKTFDDLLDPRWKGKIAWRINTASGTPLFLTSIRMARGEDAAMAYFRKLAEQKIVNFGSGSARTLVDRVIAGEFPIALNIFAHHPLISKAKGAPVDSKLMDPVPATAGTMIIPKGVRRPHAALLLADFILSKEGQQILASADYFPARPDVPPKEELASVIPARAGVPELFVNSEQLNSYGERSQKIFEELFR